MPCVEVIWIAHQRSHIPLIIAMHHASTSGHFWNILRIRRLGASVTTLVTRETPSFDKNPMINRTDEGLQFAYYRIFNVHVEASFHLHILRFLVNFSDHDQGQQITWMQNECIKSKEKNHKMFTTYLETTPMESAPIDSHAWESHLCAKHLVLSRVCSSTPVCRSTSKERITLNMKLVICLLAFTAAVKGMCFKFL